MVTMLSQRRASLGSSRDVRRVEIGKPVDSLLQGAGWSANILFQVLKAIKIQVLVLSESTALLCLSVILVVKCAGWK